MAKEYFFLAIFSLTDSYIDLRKQEIFDDYKEP